MRFFRNASKKVKKRSMSKNGCRVQSLEDAPRKMYVSLLEKKGTKSRDQKKFDVPEIKKLVIYNIKWCQMDGTYDHSICAFAI